MLAELDEPHLFLEAQPAQPFGNGIGPQSLFQRRRQPPENKARLKAVLTYHVVPGKVMAADVTKKTSATTVEGSDIRIAVRDGSVLVNDATVVKADVAASNGVIHVIDAVILPPAR